MSQKLRFFQDSLARISEALPDSKHNTSPERPQTLALWFESPVPVRIWETSVRDRLGETASYRSKLFL